MTNDKRGTNRRNVLKGAGVAGAIALAGCLGDSGGSSDSQKKADSIDAWSWDVAAKSLELTAKSYKKDNDATVNVKQIGRSDMKDKYKSKLLAGSGAPAVATMESVDAAAWVDTGGLRDISNWLESDLKEKFVSGKWGPLTKDGKTYALPWDIGPVGTFYRKDVLDKHDVNLDSVETWTQFVEEGKKLPDGTAMLNIPSNDYDGLWRMQYRQLGGQPFTKDGKVGFNNEKSVRVARNLKQLRDAGITDNKASWSSAWFSAFKKGSIASLNAGAWMEGTLKSELPDTSGNWRVMKPPAFEKGGRRASNWGGSNLVIADQVSDAKANRGWDYMKYTLGNKERQTEMYREYGIFPAFKPAYESDAFDEGHEFLGGQSAGRMFAEIAPNIPSYRYTTDTPEVTKAINTHFKTMMSGKISPKKAVEKAAKQVADRTDRKMA
ncbi:ABC transporter substrate-binding protein [Haladaptatus sp. W1]|uniref:ABC transporter substrate-binding protein n=1 Tax=Haladaptatus sp. W1 TaxID=1897478 RepID=UPI000849C176|nr:substrate-binding domain-containing protein [Haladaptatus sp. W1]ODR82498.1 ABC transporter substrate-binding protein [Haladaptatus sp. W1]